MSHDFGHWKVTVIASLTFVTGFFDNIEWTDDIKSGLLRGMFAIITFYGLPWAWKKLRRLIKRAKKSSK